MTRIRASNTRSSREGGYRRPWWAWLVGGILLGLLIVAVVAIPLYGEDWSPGVPFAAMLWGHSGLSQEWADWQAMHTEGPGSSGDAGEGEA